MASLEQLADVFDLGGKAEGDWTTLANVSAVNPDGSLSCYLSGSASPSNVSAFCTAQAGDVVVVLVSKGKARAIARRGADADRVIETGTDGDWSYRKWASGTAECWGTHVISISLDSRQAESVSFPPGLFASPPTATANVGISGTTSAQVNYTETSASGMTCYVYSSAGSGTASGWLMVHALGRWE